MPRAALGCGLGAGSAIPRHYGLGLERESPLGRKVLHVPNHARNVAKWCASGWTRMDSLSQTAPPIAPPERGNGVKEREKVPELERIGQLELVVTELDAHIQHLHGVLASLQRNPQTADQEDAEIERKPMRDSVWACENCNARLGIYNSETCELRIRYKDFVAYVKPGKGGHTMVPCRRCGEQNKLEDTTAR
jgi:hypothetical protein